MNLTKDQITEIASSVELDYAILMTFISIESGGSGFNTDGKIIIQFEPTWFNRYLTQFKIAHTFSHAIDEHGNEQYIIQVGNKVIRNGVEGQTAEWKAFDTAFYINAHAAMLSTSIGLMQIMGFNYADMGYKSVDEMWDDFKKGEYQQVAGGARFIKNNHSLYTALKNKDWGKVAYYYNGPNYKKYHYDEKLAHNYNIYSA